MATQQMSVTMTGFAATHPTRHGSIAKLVTFRMASTPRWNDNGEWKDGGTLFIDVQCWGRLGDHVMQSVVKGAPLVIAGRMNSYTFTPESGARKGPGGEEWKETIWRVTATNVGLDLSHSASTWSLRDRVKEAPDGDAEMSASAGASGVTHDDGPEPAAAVTGGGERDAGERELTAAGHDAPF